MGSQGKRLFRRYFGGDTPCANNFKYTVIFEPYARVFPVTRMAKPTVRPMDMLDGYDLLSQKGRSFMFTTIRVHRPYLTVIAFDSRMWSLLTNLDLNIDWESDNGKGDAPAVTLAVP